MEKSKEYLSCLLLPILDYPDSLKIEARTDEMGVLLSVHVDAKDMGKVVGRSGNTIASIRNLVRIVGIRESARVNIKVEEPEGSTHHFNAGE